jgi:hypothetical protein
MKGNLMDKRNKQATLDFLRNLTRSIEKDEITDFLVSDIVRVRGGYSVVSIKYYDEVAERHRKETRDKETKN